MNVILDLFSLTHYMWWRSDKDLLLVVSLFKTSSESLIMSKDEFFIEKRPQGDFAVRRPNSERASAVESTQKDAIARAKGMNPDATIHVERVRNTDVGHPDKWRKL
jgi:hypothetical protein